MAVSRFKGGRLGAVYTCHVCGKKTRDTGRGEREVEMCRACFIEASNYAI